MVALDSRAPKDQTLVADVVRAAVVCEAELRCEKVRFVPFPNKHAAKVLGNAERGNFILTFRTVPLVSSLETLFGPDFELATSALVYKDIIQLRVNKRVLRLKFRRHNLVLLSTLSPDVVNVDNKHVSRALLSASQGDQIADLEMLP